MQANKVKALSARLEGMKTHMKPKEVKVKIPKEKKKKDPKGCQPQAYWTCLQCSPQVWETRLCHRSQDQRPVPKLKPRPRPWLQLQLKLPKVPRPPRSSLCLWRGVWRTGVNLLSTCGLYLLVLVIQTNPKQKKNFFRHMENDTRWKSESRQRNKGHQKQ